MPKGLHHLHFRCYVAFGNVPGCCRRVPDRAFIGHFGEKTHVFCGDSLSRWPDSRFPSYYFVIDSIIKMRYSYILFLFLAKNEFLPRHNFSHLTSAGWRKRVIRHELSLHLMEQGRSQSDVWDELSVLPQGCTSKTYASLG